jgi:hypothetical protein
MRLRALSIWLLIGAATLAAPACGTDAPGKDLLVPLVVLNDRLAICRLDSGQPLPPWAQAGKGEFFSATRTPEELSVIVAGSRAPPDAKCERDWRLLKVRGPLDFNLVGIIAGLSGTLADAGVSIFALSTYDTDYLMVKEADFDRAVAALRQAGYPISEP